MNLSPRRRRRTRETPNATIETYDFCYGYRNHNPKQNKSLFFRKIQRHANRKQKYSIVIGVVLVFIWIYSRLFPSFNLQSISKEIDPLFHDIDSKELKEARKMLIEARSRGITPIQFDIDKEKYTVRINTWHRNDILPISVRHFRSCSNVAQVQIVWCDKENEPPDEILNMEKEVGGVWAPVMIERHLLNSLNGKFELIPFEFLMKILQ